MYPGLLFTLPFPAAPVAGALGGPGSLGGWGVVRKELTAAA